MFALDILKKSPDSALKPFILTPDQVNVPTRKTCKIFLFFSHPFISCSRFPYL